MKNRSLLKIFITVSLLLMLTVMVSCNKSTTSNNGQQVQDPTDPIYQDISIAEALTMIQNNQDNADFFILDVRTPAEFIKGHIENAINIDYYAASFSDDLIALDNSKMYLIYCRSGNRSGQAHDVMQTMNFHEVYNMLGGMNSWNAAGYPVVQ